MALSCPNCKSGDTQTGVHQNQCLSCGALFTNDGKLASAGMDDSTRAAFEQRMAPRTQTVVGNLADLQRAGAAAAVEGEGGLAATATLPPNVNPEDVRTPAQQDEAAGAITRETERTGAAEKIAARQAQAPPEDHSLRSVDPTSQSPKQVKAGSRKSEPAARKSEGEEGDKG